MKKFIMLAALTAVALQAPAAQAQSRYDKVKERVRAKAKATPSVWEEMRQEDAARAAREKRENSDKVAAYYKKYGTYIRRGDEIVKTLYSASDSNIFIYSPGRGTGIYNEGNIRHVKDESVRKAFVTTEFETNLSNYRAANIANNGIVESVVITYVLNLPGYTRNFITRVYAQSSWGVWSGSSQSVGIQESEKFQLFEFRIERRADGQDVVSLSEKFANSNDTKFSILTYFLNNGGENLDLAPLNCDWDSSFNPDECVSWHSGSQANQGYRAAIGAPKTGKKYVMMKFTPEAYNKIWDNSLSKLHPDYPSSYIQKECKEEEGRCRNVASGSFMGRRMLKLSQENRVIVKVSEGSFELDKDILEIVEVDEMGNPKN